MTNTRQKTNTSHKVRPATADLPSRFGQFTVVAFLNPEDQAEIGVLMRGDLQNQENVPVRLHSACFTGDLMGSLRCDCSEQLEASLTYIGQREAGAVIYLPQEGRGIGLINKIKAYALQEQGLDTVEANIQLGFPDDLREYKVAADIIKELGILSVCLLTNNPKKRVGIEKHGVVVSNTIPIIVEPNTHNERYLSTKRDKSGHLL